MMKKMMKKGEEMSRLDVSVMWVASFLSVVFFLLVWGFCYEVLGFRQVEWDGLVVMVLSLVFSMFLSFGVSARLVKL